MMLYENTFIIINNKHRKNANTYEYIAYKNIRKNMRKDMNQDLYSTAMWAHTKPRLPYSPVYSRLHLSHIH